MNSSNKQHPSSGLVNGYGGKDTTSNSSGGSSGDSSHDGSKSPLDLSAKLRSIASSGPPPHSGIFTQAGDGGDSVGGILPPSSSTAHHHHLLHNGPPTSSSSSTMNPGIMTNNPSSVPNSLANSSRSNARGNSTNNSVSLRSDVSSHQGMLQQQHSSVNSSKVPSECYREEDLDHMQSVADDLVSKLVDEDHLNNANNSMVQGASHHHHHHHQQQQPPPPPSASTTTNTNTNNTTTKQGGSSSAMPQSLLNPPAGFMPLPEHSQTIVDTAHKWYYTDPQVSNVVL